MTFIGLIINLWYVLKKEDLMSEFFFQWKIASRKDGTREMRAFAVGSQNPPPFNLTIYKGRKAWKLPRSFVKFLLTHPVVHEFGKWARTISISDEYFIATLARISDTTVNHSKLK